MSERRDGWIRTDGMVKKFNWTIERSFENRHESTKAYIDYMRPRCVELHRVLKKTGSFYYHCVWHASHYVKVMLDQMEFFASKCTMDRLGERPPRSR